MLCLGLSGGLSKDYENSSDLPSTFMHDGAAVPVRDGRVIAAVEEERLNRIKHSNKLPTRSIQYCLASAGVHLPIPMKPPLCSEMIAPGIPG
jgi:predicted NodU family carbamoyl transferase